MSLQSSISTRQLTLLRRLVLWSPLIVTTVVAVCLSITVEPAAVLAIPVALAALPVVVRPPLYDVIVRGLCAMGLFLFSLWSIASVGSLFLPSFAIMVVSALAVPRDDAQSARRPQ